MSLTVVGTKIIGASEQVLINKYGDGTLEYQRLLKTTGTTTSGSPTVSSVASTNGIFVGAPISGTGIPAGATVASFVANTSITLSANATASGTGVAVTINKTKGKPSARRTTEPGPTWERRLFDELLATN